jgi:hypothetical protein
MRSTQSNSATPPVSNPPQFVLPKPALTTAPRVTSHRLSSIECLPKELMLQIGSHLELVERIRLRRSSTTVYLALAADFFVPLRQRVYTGNLMSLPNSGDGRAIYHLGCFYSVLDLTYAHFSDAAIVCGALLAAPNWNCLKLDFVKPEAPRRFELTSLLKSLLAMFKDKPQGWTCHIDLTLPWLDRGRESELAKLVPLISACQQISCLSLGAPVDGHCMELISHAKELGGLEIHGFQGDGLEQLAATLKNAKATRIAHLSLENLPQKTDLTALCEALQGKSLRSLKLSRSWVVVPPALNEPATCSKFLMWNKLGLEALSLEVFAHRDDGEELKTMLQTTTTLRRLELSGICLERIQDSLAQGLRLNHTLKVLHLKYDFKKFPMPLLNGILNSTGICWAKAESPGKPTPSLATYFVVERDTPDSFLIQSMHMPARDLPELSSMLGRLSGIDTLHLSDWDRLPKATQWQHKFQAARLQCHSFKGLQSLCVAPCDRFSLPDLPFDVLSIRKLDVEAKDLDLQGIDAMLAHSKRLTKLRIMGGAMSHADGQALLAGLKSNNHLASVSLTLCFQDKEDHVLCVHLVAALIEKPSIRDVQLEFDNENLAKACQKLLGRAGKEYISVRMNRSRTGWTSTLHKRAGELVRQLHDAPVGQPLEEPYDPKWNDDVCSTM